ncbi:MAG: hypothetical protein RL479_2234, partial [Verrucomicrobiota bacterium]
MPSSRALALLLALCPLAAAANPAARFQQLEQLLPTPNAQRNAAGAPGPAYWQNRADHVIEATLDEATHRLSGQARITYHNASPDALDYLWLQLDPNFFARGAAARELPRTPPESGRMSYRTLQELLVAETYHSDLRLRDLRRCSGWTCPLRSPPAAASRSPSAGTTSSTPPPAPPPAPATRCSPTGTPSTPSPSGSPASSPSGEFTLEFGDYDVRLTVPADHVVTATGELRNPAAVLSPAQRERLRAAETAPRPVFIVTPEEAEAAAKGRATGTRTWHFTARNVRDFAFASSRRFVWDAQGAPGHRHEGRPVLAMSLYPREAMPLWDRYSTAAIVHTLDVYGRLAFPYPYPVAISVNAPVGGGMEYPMICFNRPRPEADGTYPKRTKYALIGVVIHEVGHNWFPMIVNSDERQWTWLDEGLNSFLQLVAQEEWEQDYPQRRDARLLRDYLRRPGRVPVMTQSDSIVDLSNNAYHQPAVALNLLRDVVLGRERFDHAFRTFSRRWQFKRPTPADFFRTMEDASGTDLDWFWRGWFYSTDHVDLAIEQVRWLQLDRRDPAVEKPRAEAERRARPVTTTRALNASLPKRVDQH